MITQGNVGLLKKKYSLPTKYNNIQGVLQNKAKFNLI